jgi:hypothetical protein
VWLQHHRRVFDDSSFKPAGALTKCVQDIGRVVRRRALGTGLLGEDDPCGGPPFSPHNISSTMSAKKNNRPRFGRVGASVALRSGVGGKLDKSICAKKWRGVPV